VNKLKNEDKISIKKGRNIRAYAEFWHTSWVLLEHGKKVKKGSFHQFMASLVFSAFSLEAYLNHLGPKVYLSWKNLERLNPYEKLEVIAEKIGLDIDYGKRPWQTMKKLFSFRNLIAHGKTTKKSQEITMPLKKYSEKIFNENLLTEWEEFSTEKNAERTRDDIKKIVNLLHDTSGIIGERPFMMGMHSAETEYHPPA
jgi:hypothetical protein